MKKNTFRLLSALICFSLMFSCSAKNQADPLAGLKTVESRWSGLLSLKGENTPLYTVLLTGETFDGRARLLIVSAFGASLADCRLERGRADCRNAAPGLGAISDKVSSAFINLLGRDGAFLLEREERRLEGPGWEAQGRAETIEYRNLKGPAWTLNLKNDEAL